MTYMIKHTTGAINIIVTNESKTEICYKNLGNRPITKYDITLLTTETKPYTHHQIAVK